MVDAWQLESWEAYRDVVRLGRKTRLPEKRRVVLWSIFEQVRSSLRSQDLVTYSDLFSRLASKLTESRHPPFDFTVVDESQDISVAQLRFLAALGAGRPNSLFFAGDLASGFFSNPSRGKLSASMFAGGPPRCESITGPHTRSEWGRTAC